VIRSELKPALRARTTRIARIAGVAHCVAYGPGQLEQAHQIDEWCDIDDLVSATRLIASPR
jgi:acetylornithine deacetylase/succinyl-diaminopimelate desuccinylase-like protein